MALVASDGGGGLPKPTVTKTGDTPVTKTLPTLTGTSTRPSKSGGSTPRGTAFNKKPVDPDGDGNLSLRDAVRTRTKTSSSTPSTTSKPIPTTPAPSKPRPSQPAKAITGTPTKSSITKPSKNDGRATTLNATSREGLRDAEIDRLRATKATLEAEEVVIKAKIEDISEEIDGDETKKSIVETGVSIVTSPVTAIAGLFGKPNPIADAAGAATEQLLGMQADREELEEQQEELAEQKAEIIEELEKLETEVTLNAITESLHTVAAGDDAVALADGASTRIKIVDEDDKKGLAEMSGGDAAYLDWNKEIAVREGYLDGIAVQVKKLQDAGVMDENGNVTDARRFDEMTDADLVLGAGALLIHEAEHEHQHAHGESDANQALMDANLAEATTDGVGFTGALQSASRAGAVLENEVFRIVREEVPAYHEQIGERYEQFGIKRTAQGTYLTEDADGNKLPDTVAAARVFNFMFAGDPGDLQAQLAGYAGNVDTASGGAADSAGDPGRQGKPALTGDPGRQGAPALFGDPGRQGKPALTGDPGRQGAPGRQGKPGTDPMLADAQSPNRLAFTAALDVQPADVNIALEGLGVDATFEAIYPLLAPEAVAAFLGSSSDHGDDHDHSDPGRQGKPAEAGDPGRQGAPAFFGDPGRQGAPAFVGDPGRQGAPAFIGDPGRQGAPGRQGKPGETGIL